MSKFIGLLVIFITVFGGYLLEGGSVMALCQPAEALIILGAGVGSLVISTPIPVLKDLLAQMKNLATSKDDEDILFKDLFCLMDELMTQIQYQGLKILDQHLENPENSTIFSKYPEVQKHKVLFQFLIDNLRLQTIGKISPHDLEDMLDMEIERIETDSLRASSALGRTAEAMPGFGILAAVMGIIITMSHIDGAVSMIGVRVAAALVGTFIGIFFCYAILEPIAKAIEAQVEKEISHLKCLSTMLGTFAKGKPPIQALDAGRKQIQRENKISFMELEEMIKEQDA